ncbi:hypothetical protein IE53DRAFT_363730 [Violaceomyces palustris]|uniref:Uncharacterized protein n=1 Tax=Violaceomyces palustris TaxID=1673888 RepID=A0ACD0NSD0_9BASI|nr:hypothetical protein IE53DRAFT_363730 [Violaceomyces palustris]
MSFSGTTAIPIRQAGPADKLGPGARDALSATPGGMNFYGSTPGGTRIVYSRDQLLSLASSPLSQTPPKFFSAIPPEISKSPDRTSRSFGKSPGTSFGKSPGASFSSFSSSPNKFGMSSSYRQRHGEYKPSGLRGQTSARDHHHSHNHGNNSNSNSKHHNQHHHAREPQPPVVPQPQSFTSTNRFAALKDEEIPDADEGGGENEEKTSSNDGHHDEDHHKKSGHHEEQFEMDL